MPPAHGRAPLDGLRHAFGEHAEIRHRTGARASSRLPVADTALLENPDSGLAGFELRFLDDNGVLLGTQHRTNAKLTWMEDYDTGLPRNRVSTIELRARLHAPESGPHRLGCAGVGPFTLEVDGRTRIEQLSVPPDGDLLEALVRPPQRAVSVSLESGESSEITLRYRPDPHAPATTFALLLEPPTPPEDTELAEAVRVATRSDVAIVVVGTAEETETEGFDRKSLALPGRQDELVRRVAAVNPRTVVVVNSGAPVLLPWLDEAAAVLLSWFPGQEFGNALADVLTGAVERAVDCP